MSQAHSVDKYRNTKKMLIICNSNIYFNKQSLDRGKIPNYLHIQVTHFTQIMQDCLAKPLVLVFRLCLMVARVTGRNM